jgi:hypothetical protein
MQPHRSSSSIFRAPYRPRPVAFWWYLLAALAWFVSGGVRAEDVTQRIVLPSGAEFAVSRHAADGDVLALWFTGQFGRVEEEHRAAADMAARGVETWVVDLLAPYFLPLLPSSWALVPDRDLGDLLDAAHRQYPDRRIVLVAPGRAAAIALRAAMQWRLRHGAEAGDGLAGTVLMFPLLYQELVPGEEPSYDPIVHQSRGDIVILQPTSSAGFWWRERLQSHLQAAGSRVRVELLPGLRDGFYRRADINERELAAARELGDITLRGLHALLESGQRP